MIMKTTIMTRGKVRNLIKRINEILAKRASNYIESVSKALYSDSDEIKYKNDKHRIFLK